MRFSSFARAGLLCVLVAAGCFSCRSTPSGAHALPQTPLNVAVVTGGHGYDQDQFLTAFDRVAPARIEVMAHPQFARKLEEGFSRDYDAVVLYNFDRRLTDAQRQGFLDLLEKGTGLVALHHGVAAYPKWPEYPEIIGVKYFLEPGEWRGKEYARCQWKHDVEMPVHVAAEDHPVTRGLEDFTIHDETYKGQWFDPDATVLLTTDRETSDRVVAQAKRYGETRTVYLQLGHGARAYNNGNFQEVLARAVRWTAGAE